MTSKKRLVLFTHDDTPEEPGPVKLTFAGEPPSDPRWQEVTNYRRRLVVGGENQMLSLRFIEFGPNVVVPRHRHDSHEIIYIISGELKMGNRRLGPGDGMSMPPNTPYGYTAGPEGVTILEARDKEYFTTEFLDGGEVVATNDANAGPPEVQLAQSNGRTE
jgi:quercetin dioxygenase-like cupin family protein